MKTGSNDGHDGGYKGYAVHVGVWCALDVFAQLWMCAGAWNGVCVCVLCGAWCGACEYL
jgi:hypothetical protein